MRTFVTRKDRATQNNEQAVRPLSKWLVRVQPLQPQGVRTRLELGVALTEVTTVTSARGSADKH